jgi:hypothetical protein
LIAFGDVISSKNVIGFYNIFNASSNQHPIIDVPIINLIDSLNIKLTPLGSLLESFGINAHVLFPPFDVLAP